MIEFSPTGAKSVKVNIHKEKTIIKDGHEHKLKHVHNNYFFGNNDNVLDRAEPIYILIYISQR